MAARKRRVPGNSLLHSARSSRDTRVSLLVGFAYKMIPTPGPRARTAHPKRYDEVKAEHERLLARKAYVQTNEYAREIAARNSNGAVTVITRQRTPAAPTPTPTPAAPSRQPTHRYTHDPAMGSMVSPVFPQPTTHAGS